MMIEILAQVAPTGRFDFTITLGNVLTLLTLVGSLIGLFFKFKYGMEALQGKDAEQGLAIAANARTIEALDKNGTTGFTQFRAICEKQLDLSDIRLRKIEENIIPKIEKMTVQLDIILKWIDKQEDKHKSG